MSAFTSPLDLASLTANRGIRLTGTVVNEATGWSLSSAGDINGDGYGDIIIGGFLQGAQGRTSAGSAYVVFGRADGWGDLNLGNLGTYGFRIDGLAAAGNAEQVALPVSAAGDVNGDGFGDLLVGAQLGDANGRFNSGSTYLIYGGNGLSNIDLTKPLGGAGARIDGAAAGDLTGQAVAQAGDINGDGYADIIIGGQNFSNFGTGSTYVVFGSPAGVANLDLAAAGAAAWRIDGPAGGFTGRAVASGGDFNGDGLADIITAGEVADSNGRVDSGSVYIVFGKTAGFGTLDLAGLGQGGWRIDGASSGDLAGYSVSFAGDVNGDGFTDIIIGAPDTDNNGRTDSGSAYVMFGRSGGFGTIDLANQGSWGLRIDGAAQYDRLGSAVSSAGDVNGDGFADLLVGAPGAGNNARNFSGSTYLILGGNGLPQTIDLGNPGAQAIRFEGAAAGDRMGQAVSSAGDANGDGYGDLLLGAYLSDPSGLSNAGTSYLLFSQAQGNTTFRGTTLADTLRGTEGNDNFNAGGGDDQITGLSGNDALDAGAGDDTINGGEGIDVMTGGLGDDTFFVDNTADTVNESLDGGNDTVWLLSPGAFILAQNIETIRLADAATQVTATDGGEVLVANQVLASRVEGAGGDDTLWGGGAAHTLTGGAGDDIIRGQDSAGIFIGGTGNDQYVIGNAAASILENAGEGQDTAWVAANGFTVAPNVEITRLAIGASSVTGSESEEQIVANPLLGSSIDARGGNDVLWGGAQADILAGGTGDDIIRGQGGADTMYGGAGDDAFVILDNGAVVIESLGEGYDTAWIAVNGYALGANVERINLSGQANNASGNASDNVIVGNPTMGNEFLVGGAGNDIIFGSTFADSFRGDAGNDILYSLGGADQFVYSTQNWGFDQISGFTQGLAKLDFRGSGLAFNNLFINNANGNSQVEFNGQAILVFGVAGLTAGDFLF